jgi:hypothetical protein
MTNVSSTEEARKSYITGGQRPDDLGAMSSIDTIGIRTPKTAPKSEETSALTVNSHLGQQWQFAFPKKTTLLMKSNLFHII